MSEVEHEVTAVYSGGPGEPYYQPEILCSCGFSTGRELTWAEAGAAYDEHLQESDK